jgi:hypothetical protein
MLTIKQLAALTTKDRKQRSTYVKIAQNKIGHNKQGLGFIAAKTYSSHTVNNKGNIVPNPSPIHYVSVITFLDKKLHVHVGCSCDDNLFRYEFANTDKDASEIEYSNGEPPDTMNPQLVPGLCKHLYRVYLSIKNKLP